MAYITPTNPDNEGKTFTFIVTGNKWTENQFGNGKKDRTVKGKNGDDDVLVLTEGWFKDSNLENVKVGDKIILCFDKSKDEWFNVDIASGELDGNQVYLTNEQVANIDSGNSVNNDPITTSNVSSGPNWDKIAAGKVRHAFALAAFNMNWDCDQKNKDIIEAWVKFVMDKEKPHTDEDLPF
jgi:hypothetical protein